VKFFIPDLRDDPAAAEAKWQHYLDAMSAPADSMRVYSLTYEHEGSKYVATVGEERLQYARKTGPRGGYIKNAGYVRSGRRTGTMISGIVHAGGVIHVWSYGPPFGGWANPSLVGPDSVTEVKYFD
jgi:hypothetical protein